MPLSFLFAPPTSAIRTPVDGRKHRVLVTGANGNIGSYFAQHAHDKYDLTLMVHHPEDAKNIQPFGKIITADLSNLPALAHHCQQIDTVLHLAGAASPSAPWADLLPANIVGTYHTFVAAKAAGCRRVIYASSIHAVSGTPRDVQSKPSDPVAPGDLYGVTKCFGEALARYFATHENLPALALRIGGFQPTSEAKTDTGLAMLDAFITQPDMQQILEKCIDDTSLQFALLNCLSGNTFNRLDISDTRDLLAYRPQGDTTELNPQLDPLDLDQKVVAHNTSDPIAGYPSGIRDDLARARQALQPLPASPKTSRKEPPMPANKKPAKSTPRKAAAEPRASKVNPEQFGEKTSPVREKMARDIVETPPEERIKKGR